MKNFCSYSIFTFFCPSLKNILLRRKSSVLSLSIFSSLFFPVNIPYWSQVCMFFHNISPCYILFAQQYYANISSTAFYPLSLSQNINIPTVLKKFDSLWQFSFSLIFCRLFCFVPIMQLTISTSVFLEISFYLIIFL